MYASLSLELFMHPFLVLFTLQKHFRKNKYYIPVHNHVHYLYFQP